MKYMGSKNRIAKFILPIMLKNRQENQYYVEPFCGGCNMIDKVTGNRIAADANKYLIAMWKSLAFDDIQFNQNISKEIYIHARSDYNNHITNNFSTAAIGWIGFMASFNGRFFDGGYSGKSGARDYIKEQIRNTLKQVPLLKNVEFQAGDYSIITIPDKSIIYCDPPYENTTQYAISKNFNYGKFWQWCRDKASDGHTVFISEYSAPNDFIEIWSKPVTNSMNQTKTIKSVEKLFIHKSQHIPTSKFFKL